jgi:hypothetical protein
VDDNDVADRIARGFIKGLELLSPDRRAEAAPNATGEIYNRVLAFAKRLSPNSDAGLWPPQAQIEDGACNESLDELVARAERIQNLMAELREDQ